MGWDSSDEAQIRVEYARPAQQYWACVRVLLAAYACEVRQQAVVDFDLVRGVNTPSRNMLKVNRLQVAPKHWAEHSEVVCILGASILGGERTA